jgi:hypothetical protein
VNTAVAPSRQATPADLAAITALLVTALEPDPVAEWLVPDPQERTTTLHRLLAVDVDHAIDTGHVDVTLDWTAVTVWRTHNLHADRWVLGDHHLTTFAGRAAPRISELNTAIRSYRPDAPHHWLSWLAVQPGYPWPTADGLLHQHHQVVDRTGHPAYTVVTNESARDLLCQHGYRADLPLHLPSGPRLWPLHRSPHPTPPPTPAAAG